MGWTGAVAWAAALAAGGGRLEGELGAAIDDYLSRMEGLGFAGAVVVARGDEVVLEKGYGMADRAAGVPNGPDTVFSLGSITKHFTAAAVLRLEMDGELSVEDPLERFFPDAPPDKRSITLHQLLSHTSGLPESSQTVGGGLEREELVRRVLATELYFPPGRAFSYSNLGFELLAAVVEEVSGTSFDAYLRAALFEPCGMASTGFANAGWTAERVAHGYADDEDVGTFLGSEGLRLGNLGSGGLRTTTGDMLRWNRGLDAETVLSAEVQARMFTPHAGMGPGAGYGYGTGVLRTDHGTLQVGHNGSNDVYSADFRRYPEDDDLLIFAASNDNQVYCFDLTPKIERLVFGEPIEDPPRTIALGSEELEAYVGTWRIEDGGTVLVETRAGGLLLSSGDAAGAALVHPVRADQVARREALARSLAAAYEAAFGGELAPLHALIDPQAPFDAFAEQVAGFLDGWTREHGEPRGVRVVSGVHRFGEVALIAELAFAKGTVRVEYSFGADGEVGSIRFLEGFPRRVVRPLSPEAFVAYDAATGSSWQVRFRLENGTPTALLLLDESDRPHPANR